MALIDYLAGRRSEIEAQIKALKGELSDIRIAEAALLGESKTPGAGASGSSAVKEGSIKDWVLKVLDRSWEGYETDEILKAISTIGGPDIPRTSITPQLSRLKQAGLIVLDDRKWMRPRPEPEVPPQPERREEGGFGRRESFVVEPEPVKHRSPFGDAEELDDEIPF